MAEVVTFPGKTSLNIPPERILEAAKGKVSACMVVGIGEDGSLYVASSQGDVHWAHWMLNNAVAWLCDQERATKGW